MRGFCEELERNGTTEDSQVRQADQALRIYFVNFLKRTDWPQRPASTVVETTMVYTHVVKELRMPARSPLDVIHSGTRPWPPDYDRV